MQAKGEIVKFSDRAPDPLEFATFYAEEHEHLFKALYFVTGHRADAYDLMQDAFLKLWERWDSIDRIDDPTAYLFRVALNGSRMRARAARRAAKRLVAVDSPVHGRPSLPGASTGNQRPSRAAKRRRFGWLR